MSQTLLDQCSGSDTATDLLYSSAPQPPPAEKAPSLESCGAKKTEMNLSPSQHGPTAERAGGGGTAWVGNSLLPFLLAEVRLSMLVSISGKRSSPVPAVIVCSWKEHHVPRIDNPGALVSAKFTLIIILNESGGKYFTSLKHPRTCRILLNGNPWKWALPIYSEGGLGKSSNFITLQSSGFVVEGNIIMFVSKVLFIFFFPTLILQSFLPIEGRTKGQHPICLCWMLSWCMQNGS